MPRTKEQEKVDIEQPLIHCLKTNDEYNEAIRLRDELEKKVKEAEMALSFGRIELVCDVDELKQREQAIENVRLGKPVTDNALLMDTKQYIKRKMALLQAAYDKQKDIVRRLEPKLWKEGLERYEPDTKTLFIDVVESAEKLVNSLLAIRRFQDRLQSEGGLSHLVVPWQIPENIFYLSDRELGAFVEISKRRLQDSENKQ
jgi:hypothetical protein